MLMAAVPPGETFLCCLQINIRVPYPQRGTAKRPPPPHDTPSVSHDCRCVNLHEARLLICFCVQRGDRSPARYLECSHVLAERATPGSSVPSMSPKLLTYNSWAYLPRGDDGHRVSAPYGPARNRRFCINIKRKRIRIFLP